MRIAGARQSCRNIGAGQNPRPITNTPSHRAVSHQSAEYFSLGQLNNSTRRRTASGQGASGQGFNVFAVTGGFQRLTGKSSDERLTRFSRYSSAIKLPSTIPPAIKLVRGDTKPSERLRFGQGLYNNLLNHLNTSFIYSPSNYRHYFELYYRGVLWNWLTLSLITFQCQLHIRGKTRCSFLYWITFHTW